MLVALVSTSGVHIYSYVHRFYLQKHSQASDCNCNQRINMHVRLLVATRKITYLLLQCCHIHTSARIIIQSLHYSPTPLMLAPPYIIAALSRVLLVNYPLTDGITAKTSLSLQMPVLMFTMSLFSAALAF